MDLVPWTIASHRKLSRDTVVLLSSFYAHLLPLDSHVVPKLFHRVRRYTEVKLYRDENLHAGMVVHQDKRRLFIVNPGKGSIVAVDVDTGRYARTAREEYPIFSNRLPSFEYSIYECVDQEEVFVNGLENPTGLALSLDGSRLFVAERGGRIHAYEVETGALLQSIDLASFGYSSIAGLAVSPESGSIYFVDMSTNQVVKVDTARFTEGQCTYQSVANTGFQAALDAAKAQVESECAGTSLSLTRDYTCKVDGVIPNGTLFEQVHTDGYASDNPDVQSTAGMDDGAALLANRTDCEYDGDLNFDALLLGGYYCHICLPRNDGASCDEGKFIHFHHGETALLYLISHSYLLHYDHVYVRWKLPECSMGRVYLR